MTSTSRQEEFLPTVLVVFGATGDLMTRKLAPSLFRLWSKDMLPPMFQVVGFSRENLDEDAFQARVGEMVGTKKKEFLRLFRYQTGLFEEKEGYESIARILGKRDEEWRVCSNKLFYLAVHPQHYETILKRLSSSQLTEPCSPEEGWTRVIVEKPFGKDLKTARELDMLLGKLFEEEQVYRIDHYLGKDTVQNILAFRFSNSFLEPAWNSKGIESIRVLFLEKQGIGDRGVFYDGVGALRDVGQNHVLQMLALFTMDAPEDFSASSLRKRRAEILGDLKALKGKDIEQWTLRGQYEGYTEEKNVSAESETETYFRIQTSLENSTWKGTRIELEAGKGMAEDRVEVEITFCHESPCLCPSQVHYKNVLHYRIQPQEGADITFWTKKPGLSLAVEERSFSFDYRKAFQREDFADAYERLLLAAFVGDQSSFVSTEEILAEWKFVDPIVRAWQKNALPLAIYKRGESGPLPKKSVQAQEIQGIAHTKQADDK